MVENTPRLHNLVVCTLCSCYPWAVLGLPPAWYKFLTAPNEDRLRSSHERVQGLYQRAYGWSPPAGDIGERRADKTMRQFIKSWITDWDIQRLYGQKDEIDTQTITTNYDENKDLEQAPPAETVDEEVT